MPPSKTPPPEPAGLAPSAGASATAAGPVADPKLTHVAGTLAHDSPWIACRFDPTGKFLFAAAQDRTVQRFELAAGKKTAFAAHESWVRAIGFSPDGERLYTGGYDGRLIVWPAGAEKPAPIQRVDAHAGWLRSLAVSPDGKLVATVGNDQLVKLWTADLQPVRTLTGHDRHVYCVVFHPRGAQLVSGDLRGVIHVWDVASGKQLRSLDAKDLYNANPGQGAEYGGVRTMAWSPDVKQLCCGGLNKANNPFGAEQDPLVLRFDWESGKVVQQHVPNGGLRGICWRVATLPSGLMLGASGGAGGGHVLFWKPDAPAEMHRFSLPNTVLDMDLHPDQLQFATAHHDRQVRLCKMTAKK